MWKCVEPCRCGQTAVNPFSFSTQDGHASNLVVAQVLVQISSSPTAPLLSGRFFQTRSHINMRNYVFVPLPFMYSIGHKKVPVPY